MPIVPGAANAVSATDAKRLCPYEQGVQIMKKLAILTAVTALAAVFGFASTAQADPFADAVESFILPNAGCLTPTAACDVTSDDADNGADALGAPQLTGNGGVGPDDNTATTTLGFDTDSSLGGVLVLQFTDNVCFTDDGAGNDLGVFGETFVAETYDVEVGLIGGSTFTFVDSGSDGTSPDSFDVDPVLIFNRVRLTATGDGNDAGFFGADVDSVECLDSMDAEVDIDPTDDGGGGGFEITFLAAGSDGSDIVVILNLGASLLFVTKINYCLERIT